MTNKTSELSTLDSNLRYLKLRFIMDNYQAFTTKANKENLSHITFLTSLIEGEALHRQDNSTARKIKNAKFPVLKTIDNFQWNWPTNINTLQIKSLFHLNFLKNKTNVVFLGGVGIGKTHLSIALAHHACLSGYSVLFCSTVDAINHLIEATSVHNLSSALQKYLKPDLLVLDELGYLPIDKIGADLLFQIISKRYQQASIIITSNKPYKDWPSVFNNDATLTSAILDRLLHGSDTVIIEGNSFRMQNIVSS